MLFLPVVLEVINLYLFVKEAIPGLTDTLEDQSLAMKRYKLRWHTANKLD